MSTVKRKTDPVARTSAALAEDQLARLKEIFPECFTEGRVDFDKLRETLGEEIDSRPERYSFTWAGKRDAIRLLQTPSRATLIPCPKESVNFEETGNLFIEGDNLEVLKLLYKSYFGRVKMIYIDPPYNTGKDFIYPDNFADPLDAYLRLTGQKEANGNLLTSNPETSGRYHSAWLSMMYPRLFLARQFLQEDGAIFISIDDHEVSGLRSIMNEIFGEENFIGCAIWQRKYAPQPDEQGISAVHEYVCIYAKSAEVWKPNLLPRTEEALSRYKNVDNDPRGLWKSGDLSTKTKASGHSYPIKSPSGKTFHPPKGRQWGPSKGTFDKMLAENRIWFGPEGDGTPALKQFLSEVQQGTVPTSLWLRTEVGDNQEAVREVMDLDLEFESPKPTRLIQHILKIATDPSREELVVDFFSGSATTAHSALELNRRDGGDRRFILVQLPEPIENNGAGTIADIGKERIRRVIKKIKKEDGGKLNLRSGERAEDLGFKVFKLGESNYKTWRGVEEKGSEAYAKTIALYTDPLVPGWKPENVIWEVIIKEGFGLNSSIEKLYEIKGNTVYRVSDPERGQTFRICLDDALKPATIKALSLGKEDLFICRDKALDDEGAANLALQCRLKTI